VLDGGALCGNIVLECLNSRSSLIEEPLDLWPVGPSHSIKDSHTKLLLDRCHLLLMHHDLALQFGLLRRPRCLVAGRYRHRFRFL